MSNLSDLMPAGASGKTIEAVATATIASKAPVILNSAGTVSPISETTSADVAPAGSGGSFTTGAYSPPGISIAWDSGADKFMLAYRDDNNSGHATAVVGTVSGTGASTTVSFGTPVVFFSYQITGSFIQPDPNNAGKYFILWGDQYAGTYDGYGIVATNTSGTTISFGTGVVTGHSMANITSNNQCVEFDPNVANQVIIAYRTNASPYECYVQAVTLSGTSVTMNTAVEFKDNCNQLSLAADPLTAGNFLIGYRDNGASYYGKAKPIVFTGTVPSVSATEVAFQSYGTVRYPSIAGDPNTAGQYLVVYGGYGSSGATNEGVWSKVATVTGGTSLAFSSEVQLTTTKSAAGPISVVSAGGGGTFLAFYWITDTAVAQDTTLQNGTITSGVVSWDAQNYTIAKEGTADFNGNAAQLNNPGRCAVTFTVYAGGNDYTWVEIVEVPVTTSNVTSTNFVGIADAGISTSATGTVVVQGGTVTGMSSLTTGGKYYVQNDGTLTSPNATEAYSINGATYDSVSFDVTQDSTITGMCFNGDGTKMYVCGEATDTIYQYSLSSAYDLSTASYDSVSLSVASQQGAPRSVVFNNDGSALYIVGTSAASAHQYTLTTPYDLSTGSYASKTVSVSTQELYPCGVIFNNDGASMYVVGSQNDTVYQYTLSTPFDVSTASYASKSMSVNSEQTSPTGLAFNSDGTKIFVIGETTPKINQYTLSSAYDISTGSYDSVSYTYSEGTVPRDIVWGNSGNKFYIPDSGPDDIYQYTPGGGASSSVNAGLAISTTALLLNGDS